jgi:hypothetical protein
VADRRIMEPVTVSVNEGFDRLQRRLLAMNVGDALRPPDAAEETGLTEDVCRAVLEGLERAGLMTHEHEDRFVRRTLEMQES